MSGATARQRYLHLMARLYELAAEFSDADLEKMQGSFLTSDDGIAKEAVAILIRLHGDKSDFPRDHAKPFKRLDGSVENSEKSSREGTIGRRAVWNEKTLSTLLEDRELFPTLREIADILPASLGPRPKEARDRYVRRAIAHIMSLTDGEKREFRARLTAFLSRKPTGFLSQWKSLIKDL